MVLSNTLHLLILEQNAILNEQKDVIIIWTSNKCDFIYTELKTILHISCAAK